ncbi:hypothetical protein Xcel_0127 [Xylanimonas cellulosilytica DSM 15894]|uniref:Uncharacterized protein n=1 Tax=Xylanimonas cellulosilytica (strain DSM 15894 / JCM 12276 / CECT 5975 / KCTC 9989 / LMG 20990 / NBRC 107835 / XIL07) TaxID=446471 RepID=D1BU04_XYLCX|nr:ABC transporter permease [Xylanimonas cellulosilytica]ACZ29168.1 hypothetical protein Xcel_0127 [Xylanimonas cellulosilytica DSM 15894]
MSVHAVARPAESTARSRVTFVRLLDVEARRTVSTRAGSLLLTVALAVVVLGTVAALTLGTPGQVSPTAFLLDVAYPLAVVLPLVAIVIVAADPRAHGDRTGARPGQVLGAKALVSAAIAVGVPLLVVALTALGVLASAATQGVDAVWDVPAGQHLRLLLFALVAMAAGFVAALAARRVPAAVVAYLAVFAGLPLLAGAVAGTQLGAVISWVDLGSAAYALQGTTMSGQQWLHLAAASALWLALPAVGGVYRTLRRHSA